MSFWSNLPRPIIGLSPMDGVTDACFRSVVARRGKPDITFTEFTHVHDVCRGPEVHLETLIYSDIERPIIAQLYGKDPDLFYQAAHAVCELGFDGLDVNMGCPSKSVAASGSGAGLIRTPALARAIIQAARQGIDDWSNGYTLEQAGFKQARIEAFHRLNQRRGSISPTQRRTLPLSVNQNRLRRGDSRNVDGNDLTRTADRHLPSWTDAQADVSRSGRLVGHRASRRLG